MKFIFSHLLVVLCIWNIMSNFAGAQNQYVAQEWKGETFAPEEGVFFINIYLNSFNENAESSFLNTSVQFQVQNIINKSTILISQVAFDKENEIYTPTYWKLKAGEYRITKVYLVDSKGITRSWKPLKQSRSFIIKPQHMSNLGRWRVSPDGQAGLAVGVKMLESDIAEDDPIIRNVHAVLNGYDGSNQKTFVKNSSQNSVVAASTTNKAGTMSKTYGFTRTVSMFYKVDLYKNNKHAKKIVKVLNVHDAKFRKCYVDILNENERVKGKVKFKFLLSKSARAMKNIQLSYENVREVELTNCLYRGLQDLRFAINGDMAGELVYTFDNY